jgi:helix-turn-helix protein
MKMSKGEHTLLDAKGKFLRVVQEGQRLSDANWVPGRVILTNKRVVAATDDGKLTVPLMDVRDIGGRYDVNQSVASVSEYVSVRHGDDVELFSLPDTEGFKWALYDALLDGEVVLAKHPAVEGGVIQEAGWEKARLSVEPDALGLAVASGSFVEVDLADVGTVGSTERTVSGKTRPVVEVEHTEGETSVETHLAGNGRRSELLESLLEDGARRNEIDVDLGGAEQQVLMALYSGVSPFEIPEFVGLEIEEVESIYERLIDLEVLDEVRKRREVALTTRGRNLASESINEE